MNVLVACEESQRVCSAFRKLGVEAYSCDIIDCSGGHPEWHIKQNVLDILNPKQITEHDYGILFVTVDGTHHFIKGEWDLIIAHPPCTYLTVTGNRWFNVEKYGEKAIQRIKDREFAIEFFMNFANAKCKHIAIENPIGIMSTNWRKPNQIIQPYWFGDPFEKRTCLWLIGLPNLEKTNEVKPEERTVYSSGSSLPTWYAESAKLPPKERARVRSQTFPGFAEAMAQQWYNFIKSAQE